jgi:2-polyprenyl-3-methyl-5-hydroxy-6-metoxy-1,4-benzoquinol methylase
MQSMINSDDYWDKRFNENWELRDGPRQSRFFAQLALDNVPSWLIKQIQVESLTVADWGCAQGDGTNVWANYINSQQLSGVDFSQIAIDQAHERYPSIQFICENWLESDDLTTQRYDVVFSSNTLEHFHNPFDVLKVLSEKANNAIVLALPYRELNRIDEHFYTFLAENIPIKLANGFHLVWSKVIDCTHIPSTQWSGHQIILIYANMSWTSLLQLKLSDCLLEKIDINKKIQLLNQDIIKKDTKISSLNQILSDRVELISDFTESIAGLTQKLSEKDVHISNLAKDLMNQNAQINFLSTELMEKEQRISIILGSTSWKITAPMRALMNFFRLPVNRLYKIMKVVFWKLPPSLRQSINTFRHYIKKSRIQRVAEDNQKKDLSWSEFNAKILINRANYKGIFIQELVIDWNVPLYQRPQHIATALGRLGYLVIYRTDNWAADNVNGFREVCPNVWITNKLEVNQISGAVHSFYSTAYALSVEEYLIAKNQSKGVLIYEYIDHIDPEISGDSENIERLLRLKEFAFNGGVDFIVASAKKLYDEAVDAIGEEKVILVPNGVDTIHYRDSIHTLTEIPVLLSEFRQKYTNVIGYFGALAPWLWYEVITELVAKRQDIGFVFIGPDYYGGAEKLPKAENVLYLGAIDYKILPAYAQSFDICFIPFKPSEIARTTSPLKLFEYFALEKPVVVTSEMLECIQYSEVFKGGTVDEISQAFDDAIKLKKNLEFKRRLSQLADENNWEQRALVMTKCFENLK